ncbi:MAG: hypothetical protein K2K15_03230 [Anaeroplasmataceae bacterium]|nr:hypothetical protein [Anaeroplasmataceae bacterium]
MQLNIEKHNFFQLEGINHIKNHLEKLNNVLIHESKATGEIELNISYNDIEGLECFKSVTLPFELDLDSFKILEILVGKVNIYLVEGQGVDVDYELIVNYLLKEEPVEEIKVIEEKDIEPMQDLEQIKEDMKEYYEDKLASNLQRNDKVITTKNHSSVNSFLDFFESKQSYYKLKCLYVETEQDLDVIAKQYQISKEKLLAGYDRESHKVIFSIG